MIKYNIFENLKPSSKKELTDILLNCKTVRIERIVSYGQKSPKNFWYNQSEDEWVIVLKGKGIIEFENRTRIVLKKGDYINIAAGCKHRVAKTSKKRATIWLAIFYNL